MRRGDFFNDDMNINLSPFDSKNYFLYSVIKFTARKINLPRFNSSHEATLHHSERLCESLLICNHDNVQVTHKPAQKLHSLCLPSTSNIKAAEKIPPKWRNRREKEKNH